LEKLLKENERKHWKIPKNRKKKSFKKFVQIEKNKFFNVGEKHPFLKNRKFYLFKIKILTSGWYWKKQMSYTKYLLTKKKISIIFEKPNVIRLVLVILRKTKEKNWILGFEK
jgi:hypothetical protein